MNERALSVVVLMLLLTSVLTPIFMIQPVKAEPGTVYIRADGSVDPPTAPIQRGGMEPSYYYDFTGDIYGSLVIERDDIRISGAGHQIVGTGSEIGIEVRGRFMVDIGGFVVRNAAYGILLWKCDMVNVGGSDFSNNGNGIWMQNCTGCGIGNNLVSNTQQPLTLWYCGGNSIGGNIVSNNNHGIMLQYSGGNNLYGNTISSNTGAHGGISLCYSSDGNIIDSNDISNNYYSGIWLSESTGNWVIHNSFFNNYLQAVSYRANIWNENYPRGGNYWNDYAGVDSYCGSNQDQLGSDGMGDTAYSIPGQGTNIDHYPLMEPYAPVGWWVDAVFSYNLDDDYDTTEGSGLFVGGASLSGVGLRLSMQLYASPLFTETPEIYLIATNGVDLELGKQQIDMASFTWYFDGAMCVLEGDMWDVIRPINDGHYELEILITYGAQKYDFFVQTNSWINSHYAPLTTMPAPPQKFQIGDRVRTTASLRVREGPELNDNIIDIMPEGTLGQIINGPVKADGYTWWEVNYDVGVRGWSAENWLELAPDFLITASPFPFPLLIPAGGSGTWTLTITSIGGFSVPVQLEVSGVYGVELTHPAEAMPPPDGSISVTLEASVEIWAPPGINVVTITGTFGVFTRTLKVLLDIGPPAPIEDVAEETISTPIQSADGDNDGSPDWDWNSRYDISFVSQTLRIEINIDLTEDDPGDALRQEWHDGIEQIWNNQYEISDGIYRYPIEVAINWVDTNPHHTVKVHSGSPLQWGDYNMENWYTDYGGQPDLQGRVAAHEVGHMMGVYDEYAEDFTDTNNNGRYDAGEPFTDGSHGLPRNGRWDSGALNPETWFITTNSLMADLSWTWPHHYQQILQWLETKSGRDLSLAPSPLPPYPFDGPVPDFSDLFDAEPPTITVIIPASTDPPQAIQDGVTFKATASDPSRVDCVTFSIREPDGERGTIIDPMFESMPATHVGDDIWQLPDFNTNQPLLPDGYYLLIVEANDTLCNEGYVAVRFSIRNWASIEVLPASEPNKAGRTMPVKFSLRIVASTDPAQPFVRNEELVIKIYARGNPGSILQTSTYGTTSRDYRIDPIGEKYITNFITLTTPRTYVVEIYRKGMLIGTFEFETVK